LSARGSTTRDVFLLSVPAKAPVLGPRMAFTGLHSLVGIDDAVVIIFGGLGELYNALNIKYSPPVTPATIHTTPPQNSGF